MLTELKGFRIVIWATIAWVSVADAVAAPVSQGDLAVLWARSHPVHFSITEETVFDYDVGVCSGEDEEG